MPTDLRPAAVAGTFYPASPRDLGARVDALLHEAAASARPAALRQPKALIVPHAGYEYSGPVAASAYARLLPFADRIHRVVLLGPSHRVYLSGLALPEAAAFATPLGAVPLDAGAAALVPGVPRIARPHAREHALEVELPFLVRVLPRFSLVPIVVGDAEPEEVAAVLDALWDGPETLIVISSDLSHYLPYAEARRVDQETANRIAALSEVPLHHEQACGATPVNGLILAARRRGLQPELLDLRSSGDTEGMRDQVVGYAAFAFHEDPV
ncbi:MAG: AmmeMemoRadiSam system protein B [Minicystis sp.]